MEENKLSERIKSYITKERKIAFSVTFIIAMIANFSYYTQLIATTDTFTNGSVYLPGEWELSIGRWGIYFLNKMRFGIVSQFFIALISFICLGVISVLINDILKVKSKLEIIMVSIVISTFPNVYNILLYTYTADTYFISMLLSILAVKFLISSKKYKNIIVIVCIVLSLSIYQSFLSITICLFFIILTLEFLRKDIDLKEFLKKIFFGSVKIIFSLILYYVITKIILKLMHIQISNYYGIHDDWKYILTNIFEGIFGTYNDWYKFYFDDKIFNNSIYKLNSVNILMFILLNINVFIIIYKNNEDNVDRFVKALTWYIVFLILPICQNIIRLIIPTAAIAPTMCTSYMVPIIMFIVTFKDLPQSKIVQKFNFIEIILIIYLVYSYIFISESTYIALRKNYNQIHSQLIRVIDRIESNEQYTEDIKIRIIGGKDYRIYLPIYEFAGLNRRVGFFGGLGNISVTYLREEFGLKNEFATDEEMEKIYKTDEYKKMKEFPDKESLKIINNVMVVKLESNEYSINKTGE